MALTVFGTARGQRAKSASEGHLKREASGPLPFGISWIWVSHGVCLQSFSARVVGLYCSKHSSAGVFPSCFHKQLGHLPSCMAHGIIENLHTFSSTPAKQATKAGNELARDRHWYSSNVKEVPKIILKARLYCSHSNAWWKSWTCFWNCNTTSGDYRVFKI